MKQPIIAVIGSEKSTNSGKDIAYRLGQLLAKEGFVVICGGRGGIMEGVSKGVYESNGITIGILPEADKSNMNPYVTIPVCTGMGFARNHIIINSADCIIAIEGHYGTLNEISIALNLSKKIICLHCNWHFDDMEFANSPDEAINLIKKYLQNRMNT